MPSNLLLPLILERFNQDKKKGLENKPTEGGNKIDTIYCLEGFAGEVEEIQLLSDSEIIVDLFLFLKMTQTSIEEQKVCFFIIINSCL